MAPAASSAAARARSTAAKHAASGCVVGVLETMALILAVITASGASNHTAITFGRPARKHPFGSALSEGRLDACAPKRPFRRRREGCLDACARKRPAAGRHVTRIGDDRPQKPIDLELKLQLVSDRA